MRSGIIAFGAICAVGAFGAVAGCSNFTEATDDTGADAGDDGVDGTSAGDGSGVLESGTADAPPGDASVAPLCPAPSGGTRLPSMWSIAPIYSPAQPEYPWGIAVAGDAIAWISQRGADAYNGNGVGTVYVSAKGAQLAPRILAAWQPGATEVVIDGDDVLWTKNDSNGSFVMSQSMSCSDSPCTTSPGFVLELAGAMKIVRLFRVAPHLVFAQRDGATSS